MATTPTAEDVLAAARRRAAARQYTYSEERYQILNGRADTHNAPMARLAELRLLADLHAFLLYRALNDTSISVTVPHLPRSRQYADSIARHILDIDLVGQLGFPHGTVGDVTAHTDHTYVLDWSPR